MLAASFQEMTSVLAQATTGRVLLWVGVTVVLVIVGSIAAVWLRRRYLDDDLANSPHEMLALHDLRRLHAQGHLSDEEFGALKEAAIRAHAGPGAAPGPSGPVPEPSGLTAEPGVDLTGDPLPAPPPPDGGNTGENGGGPDARSG